VVAALVYEWLPPLQADYTVKKARWVVQSVIEDTRENPEPLWSPGISTADYEARLDAAGLTWVVRATWGRGRSHRGTILARFSMCPDDPSAFQMEVAPAAVPETLFEATQVEEFLARHGASHESLFTALLRSRGVEPVSLKLIGQPE
jgi:hypothetical protein